MKKVLILLINIVVLTTIIYGQPTNPAAVFGVNLSGYVKTDVFLDTRQASAGNAIREGHFYLFPDGPLYDENKVDINANPSFHMLSIQSRFKADISAPDAFGAKTSGMVEAEFFGTSESDLNGLRLRHAYVKLDWEKTSLLVGQYWHPMFPVTCFPGTVSFNTGAPFVPFSRNPQVRLSHKLHKVTATVTAWSQRDFTSNGPDGFSDKYIRNSALPGLNLQLRIPVSENLYMLAGADYKTVRPELRTSSNYENPNTLESLSGFLTAHLKTKPVSATLMGTLAQNAADIIMIGGYAVHQATDSLTRIREFTNLNTASAFLDLTTNGKSLQVGLFGGYSKNLGAKDSISGDYFGRGTNIDHLWRISPRVLLHQNKFTLAGEIETTAAAYGTKDFDGKIKDA